MWPYLSLGIGVLATVGWLLYLGARKKLANLHEERGEERRANEQYQQTITDLKARVQKVIETTDRVLREKRKAARRCSADFEALALAGQNDPAVIGRLARDLEQLFALSEAETTFGGN